jgi:hypothetical protein
MNIGKKQQARFDWYEEGLNRNPHFRKTIAAGVLVGFGVWALLQLLDVI